MSDGFLEIVIFAMVAAFLVLRLRAVLGRRTGTERRRDLFARRADATRDNVVTLPDTSKADTSKADTSKADTSKADLGKAEAGKPVEAANGVAPAAEGVEAGIARIRAAD